MAARLEELESRLAFQEDLIESLNEVVARQDRDLARLLAKMQDLEARLTDLAATAAGPVESPGYEVPPHY
jgi:SlyX protein